MATPSTIPLTSSRQPLSFELGYRHFDTAEGRLTSSLKNIIRHQYLQTSSEYENEDEIGEAIRASKVPRKQLFITAKNSSLEGVTTEQALRKTLKNLGVDYVDLYLVHNAFFAKNDQDLQRKWAEMEFLKERGLTKSIGISNMERQKIEAILTTAKVPPAINQIEFHPYFQRPSLISWLKEQNIAVACYSPLTPLTAGKPGPIDGIFQELAEKYGVTTSEIGLRWCIDQGLVAVSTSSKKERIQRYMTEIPKFKLSPKEVSDIAELGKQKNFSAYWKHYASSGGDK